MTKFTVEINEQQKVLLDSLKGEDTNPVLFGKLLDAYVKPKKSYLTVFQVDYLKKLGGVSLDEHICLALDAYVRRLRLRSKRVAASGKPTRMDVAQDKAIKLIQTLIKENEAAQSPLNMFYINMSVCKKKAAGSINQEVLRRVLTSMADKLNKHHEQFGLTVNHNRPRRT
jgi:hypothetical protein